MFTFSKYLRNYLVACLVATSPISGMSQAESLGALAKAPAPVIERAKTGIAQRQFVIVDAKDILEDEKRRREARQLFFNDEQTSQETEKMLKALKAEIFQHDRFHGAYIVRDDESVPVVIMQVPDFAALSAILSHPKIISVQEIEFFKPAGASTPAQ